MDAMATTGTTDPRMERGLTLFKSKQASLRHIVAGKYLVPSATSSADYVVDVDAQRCSCPDHATRLVKCKHMYAVSYFRQEIALPDGSAVVSEVIKFRPTYPQNWPAYNRAQCEEESTAKALLKSLVAGVTDPVPPKATGRHRIALPDAIFCAATKVYGTMSGRRSTTDLRACEEKGLVDEAAHYNSVFRTIGRADLRPVLKALVEESAKPLRAIETKFAPDGTGFTTQNYVRWFDHKHGKDRRVQKWVKAHAMVGTLTNIVTAVEVTDGHANDCPQFVPLLNTTAANGFQVAEVTADKAYLSHENLAAVERIGGTPYIPFKSNSLTTGSPAWERMSACFVANQPEFLRHYHARSNVESTFSAMKRKFGANVRSKKFDAQMNEVLLKCLCHNLSMLVHAIHELGVDPKFWRGTP